MAEQRSEFRIVYPLPARPVARIGQRSFSVLDVSEQGLRLDLRRVAEPPVVGERLEGSVQLAQRAEQRFAGTVLRVDDQVAVLRFDPGFRIALPLIFQEQRFLRSRFPDWR